MTQEDIQLLWLPEVIYENTDQKESTRLGENWEWKTRVVVERNTNGTSAGLEVIDETELFQGGDNNLVLFQTYTHEFQCNFDLKRYPFDTQTCSIDMTMGLLDSTSVSLLPDQLHMEQSPDMSIFNKSLEEVLNQSELVTKKCEENCKVDVQAEKRMRILSGMDTKFLIVVMTRSTWTKRNRVIACNELIVR